MRGAPPPLWSVPIDGINSKAWQLLGDSLGKQEFLILADPGGATQAMWRPLWRREKEKRKEKSRSPTPACLPFCLATAR